MNILLVGGYMTIRLSAVVVLMAGIACLTVSAADQFVYSANFGSNSVSAFRIGPSGTLTSIGAPFPAGTSPFSIAVHPSGRFLYVGNGNSGNVSAYRIENSGILTALGAPFTVGPRPFSVAVDTTGQFLYAALEGSARIVGYRLNAAGELTTLVGSFPTDEAPRSLAVSPTGRFLYVANTNGENVGAYSIGPNGALALLGTTPAGTHPFYVAADPSGRFLYAANFGSHNVSMYAIAPNGALTSLGPAISSGLNPTFAAVEPLGRFLYVGGDSGTVSVYAIRAGGTLGLISLSQLSGVILRPASIAFEETGAFGYLADRDGAVVRALQVNPDGTLTAIGTSPTGSTPLAMAVNRCTFIPSIDHLAASPSVLWPPNHKMVQVVVDYDVTSPCGVPVCTLELASSDSSNPNDPDWVVSGPHLVQLRAERAGGSEGRSYRITVSCGDPRGNRASAMTTVSVPPDQRH